MARITDGERAIRQYLGYHNKLENVCTLEKRTGAESTIKEGEEEGGGRVD